MKNNPRLTTLLWIGLSLVLAIAAWVVFAPVQIGGRAAYVIVDGNSMEPLLQRGDLVILRQTTDYQVGDVITYRHPDLGPVIHRITAREGDRFVLQGDNTTWIDSHKPVANEIIGEMWVRLPHAGQIVVGFRTPLGAALLAGALGTFILWPELWPDTSASDLKLTEQPADQLAGRLKAFGKKLPGAPLLISKDGVLVAHSGNLSPDAAAVMAQQADHLRKQVAVDSPCGWVRLASQGPGKAPQIVLYSAHIAKGMMLHAVWDHRTTLSTLRTNTQKAAGALRDFVQ
jgi:signal peptidase I